MTSAGTNPSLKSTAKRPIFFPQAKALGLDVDQDLSPTYLRKLSLLGTLLKSFPQAAAALETLLELSGIGRKRIERITERIAAERHLEANSEADDFIALSLMEKLAEPPQPERTDDERLPNCIAVMLDGGMYQHTDVNQDSRAERPTHWNEYKSGIAAEFEPRPDGIEPGPDAPDPCPEPPECLLDVGFGARIAKEIGRKHAAKDEATASAAARKEAADDGVNGAGVDLDSVKSIEELEACVAEASAQQDRERRGKSSKKEAASLSPKVARREVVATFEKGHRVGQLLAARAWQRGLFTAKFKALVGDGSGWIQKIFDVLFKPFGFVSVLDLIHAVSYVYSSAVAGRPETEGGRVYRQWMTWIWQGDVSLVIDALSARSEELGEPREGDGASEARVIVADALRYLRNQSSRMNYPEYRKCGLPITSSLMESTVKELNYRIKGSEKFWSTRGGSGVLQLKADTLSDSKPLEKFWSRRQETRTGFRSNVGKRKQTSTSNTNA